ncbi:Major pollen allergen Cyn d 1 [Carex littledalei]|uniref:Major pollen allergen Cyn d 1 n=1 Tax=Carex littledalei TaxID=544730 RepID=A0A833QJS1_9POAL|nr:Major pollen allergen Cyn d 1 [Carex littledalei]
MTHSWANIWRLDPNHPTLPPFSIMITDSNNNRFVAKNVIPPNWKNEAVYTATLVRA